jgi:hypothetical protein
MYPEGTSIRLTTQETILDGAIGFVITPEGEWTDNGERVPEDHAEVEVNLVDPEHGGIRHRTIVGPESIDDVYC